MKLNKMLTFMLSFIVLSGSSLSFAQPPSVTNGLSYLQSAQTPAGYWGDAAEVSYNTVVDTTSVFDTFKILGETGSSYTRALQWLNSTATSNNDYLAAKIIALSNGGLDSSTPLNSLLLSRNSDGGWGADVGLGSDMKRTLLSLLALKSANYTDIAVINGAITCLTNNQNTDGGFGFYSGDVSNVYMTAVVSHTLQQFTQTTSIATAINKATGYIISQQQTNGSFGSGGATAAPTVYETALAYIALVGTTTDNTVLGNAINYIISAQSADGSWGQDPYSTALALRALHYSENKPVVPAVPPAEITPVNETPTIPATATTIAGKVIDTSTGWPISGAEVSIISPESTGYLFTVRTDSNGAFEISGISILAFAVKASATGYDSLVFTMNNETHGRYTVNFQLNQSVVSPLSITSLTTDKGSYPAYSSVAILARVFNGGTAPLSGALSIQLLDAEGRVFDTVQATANYADGPTGTRFNYQPGASTDATITWQTGNLPPGTYSVIARLTEGEVGTGYGEVVVSERNTDFIIEPTQAIGSLEVTQTPRFTNMGATKEVIILADLMNLSNVETVLNVAYDLLSPGGTVIHSGTSAITLQPDETSKSVTIEAFSMTFAESGAYPLQVRITDGPVPESLKGYSISAAPGVRIEPSQTLTPTIVVPDGDKRIRVNIRLKGVEQK